MKNVLWFHSLRGIAALGIMATGVWGQAASAPTTKPAATKPAATTGATQEDPYERAINLIAAVREAEKWLDTRKSVRIQATAVLTSSPEGKAALENEPPRNVIGLTVAWAALREMLPKMETKVEVGWDEKRVYRLKQMGDSLTAKWIFDGKEAVVQVRAPGEEQNVLDKSPDQYVSPSVMEEFTFGKGSIRKGWWAPKIPPQMTKTIEDALARYKFLRAETFGGRRHEVIGTTESEWWIDPEAKALSVFRVLRPAQPKQEDLNKVQEQTWSVLRSKGYKVENAADEQALSRRLSQESPEIFAALQRSIGEELIKSGVVRQYITEEHQLLDYQEVAPGCRWPMRQVSVYNSILPGREGQRLMQRDLTTSAVQVDQPIPNDVFAVTFTEGAKVEDYRHGARLVYAYKANRTEQEWEQMKQQRQQEEAKRQAQEQKLKELVGKPAPALAAAFWVNSEQLTLEGLKGRPVLLYFWADWYEEQSRPDFSNLEQMYQLQGHQVKVITVHAPTPLYRSFFDVDVPIMVDYSEVPPRRGMLGETAFRYGVTTLPYAILIDSVGTLVAHGDFPSVARQLMRMVLPSDPGAPQLPGAAGLPGAMPAMPQNPAK